jgi:hypothetical protein
MADESWSYFSWVVKVPSVYQLDETMNLLGAEGWELVAASTTVKTIINWTGNDLIFIFKAPGAGRQPSKDILDHIYGTDTAAAY